MGRPINKKYFGNTAGGGVGGEGFSSLVVTNTATNSGFSTTTSVTWVASDPQLAGGTPASGTASVSFVTGSGRVQSLNILSAGTGYTSTGSVTLTYSPTSAGTGVTFVLNLTSGVSNSIASSAWIPGGAAAKTADIIKQESSTRYRVATADGAGVCKLVTATPTEGEMSITATDSDGGTYYVKKLTARRAVVVPDTGTQFTTNDSVGWSLTAAEANVSVKISSN